MVPVALVVFVVATSVKIFGKVAKREILEVGGEIFQYLSLFGALAALYFKV